MPAEQNLDWLNQRVVVLENYNQKLPQLGTVQRFDAQAPWQILIELDDGRTVNPFQCSFKLATQADG